MAGEVPELFGRVPAGFFAPLNGSLAPVYWAILARFYELEFEREPRFLVREVAIDLAAELVRGSRSWRERRDEVLAAEAESDLVQLADDETEQVREVGRRLLARLERARWFHFEYRSTIGHVLAFFPYAARILDTLVRVARNEQPVFQGYAHAIASVLRPDSVAARPGVALTEAKRQTFELTRELKILERNIYAFTQRLLDEITTAHEVLEESMERYRAAVLGNYHRLKTVYNLYKWRGEILYRLDSMETNDLLLQGAASWYAEQFGLDPIAAVAAVHSDLRVLRVQFESLPAILDEIDGRNARFSGVALRKLMYLLRHDRRMEGQLQFVIESLSKEAIALPDELEIDVFRCELLGEDFLYTPPRVRPRPEPRPLEVVPGSDDDVRKVLPNLRRKFARARVEAFVDEQLGSRQQVDLTEFSVTTDDDYVRAIYLAAYGLDGHSTFQFVPDETQYSGDYGRYTVPGGSLRRKKKSR